MDIITEFGSNVQALKVAAESHTKAESMVECKADDCTSSLFSQIGIFESFNNGIYCFLLSGTVYPCNIFWKLLLILAGFFSGLVMPVLISWNKMSYLNEMIIELGIERSVYVGRLAKSTKKLEAMKRCSVSTVHIEIVDDETTSFWRKLVLFCRSLMPRGYSASSVAPKSPKKNDRVPASFATPVAPKSQKKNYLEPAGCFAKMVKFFRSSTELKNESAESAALIDKSSTDLEAADSVTAGLDTSVAPKSPKKNDCVPADFATSVAPKSQKKNDLESAGYSAESAALSDDSSTDLEAAVNPCAGCQIRASRTSIPDCLVALEKVEIELKEVAKVMKGGVFIHSNRLYYRYRFVIMSICCFLYAFVVPAMMFEYSCKAAGF